MKTNITEKSEMRQPDPYLAERFQPTVAETLSRYNTYDSYIYLDGQFLKGEEARISVWDHGFLYGDGVFEGIRAYDGVIFKLREHLDRLYDSAHAIGLTIPLNKDEMGEAIKRTFRANGLRNGHARPVVTRGVGRVGTDPRRAVRPSVMIQALELPPILGKDAIRVITSSVRRKSPHSVDAKIKSLNYLDVILARLQANLAGVNDALILDMEGFVAEATTENIFILKGQVVSTPTTAAALHGVTRQTVMDQAEAMGYRVLERNITPHEVYTADEVFLTGTGAEIVPVGEVDGRSVGNGEVGPLTGQLISWYSDYVRTTPGTPIYE